MDWESVLRSAMIGAIIGGLVGLMMAIIVRKVCPHCEKRYRLGMFGARRRCPHCGGDLSENKSADTEE